MNGENENILDRLTEANAAVRTLREQLRAAGRNVVTFGPSDSEGILAQLADARMELEFLKEVQAGKPVRIPNELLRRVQSVSATPAPAQLNQPPPTPPTQPTVPQTAPSLTTDEIALLNWTDKIHFGQGKLSVEQAREIIARKTPKKQSGQSLTAQCSAASTEMSDRAAGRK